MQLAANAALGGAALANLAWQTACGNAPNLPLGTGTHDRRFGEPEWQDWPFRLFAHTHIAVENWWDGATSGIRGLSPHRQRQAQFLARQVLDVASPANNPFLNPTVLKRTREEGGFNFVRGLRHWSEDFDRAWNGKPAAGTDAFKVGKDVAATPGKVVFRNYLMEVIQYTATTSDVVAEPVLIVPAWIMKYYILDLSAHNSLVRYLVSLGHTVFMVSWRNPSEADRNLSLDDYRADGVGAAVDAVSRIVPGVKIHGCGYCLGGTILAIAAATMARDRDDRLASLTFLAAQTDFNEAGELMLFVDEGQLSLLEDLMWDQGYLDTSQMAGAFHTLRSNDLIWSRLMRAYMLGEREEMTDLMAWNADQTRMPARMHSEYLRGLFLENRLSSGRFAVSGRIISLRDLRVPIFAVGTTKDHIAPWQSVYKLHLLTNTDITFALTNGGHNAGIVSEPGHPQRHYQIHCREKDAPYLDPESWMAIAERHEGSWWPAWAEWLSSHSSASRVSPPPLGRAEVGLPAREAAPGTYVFMR